MFGFDEKMSKVFSVGDSITEQEDDDYRDWTNIPGPKKGKTLNDLKGVKDPLNKGWTLEEVISALKPTLIAAARKYSTPNFGQDEALLAAMEAVIDAVKSDKGLAPFTSHVFPYIMSKTKRAAAGTRDFPTSNVSGVKPNVGGKTDFLKGSRATVSADTPVDNEDGEATYVSRLSSDADSGTKAAKEQMDTVRLLSNLFTSDEVGLSDQQRIIMLATYGITSDGDYSESGPKSTTEIADAFGVSKVRISQVRKKAQEKIKNYLDSRGLGSPEEAMSAFGIEEAKLIAAARVVLESLPEIIRLNIDLINEHQNIPTRVDIDGISHKAIVKINSDTFEIDDVVAEGNESVLYKIDRGSLSEAVDIAKARTGSEYFSETASTIIRMHAQPIIGIVDRLNDNEENEDSDD